MSNPINLLSPPWLAVRAQLRTILEARAERKTLERELAGYTSENDLNELSAILDRHGDAYTDDIRSILGAQHRVPGGQQRIPGTQSYTRTFR